MTPSASTNSIPTPETGTFHPWRLTWSPEHVRRFWDWLSSRPYLEALYFSSRVGHSLIRELRHRVPLRGVAVDWGAGRGHLTDRLLRLGLEVWAVDVSPGSTTQLDRQFARRRGFLGARPLIEGKLDLEAQSADFVFLIETVEHLDDVALEATLGQIRRVLRPGGYLVITTPNDEQLSALETMCPNCGCVFHTVQHLRAFTAESLTAILERHGFACLACQRTLLSEYPMPLAMLHQLLYVFTKRKMPHLLCVSRSHDPPSIQPNDERPITSGSITP